MTESIKEIEFTSVDDIDVKVTQKSIFNLDLVKNIKTQLIAQVGSVSLSVEQIYELKVGQVVELLESLDDPIKLKLDDQVVAEGKLVAIDDNYGLEITQIAAINNEFN